MEYLVAVVVLLALVALVVARPLRGSRQQSQAVSDDRRRELEAAKEAKYREIREAELDHGMGKLADEDWRRIDAELRAEAVAILRELDSLG